MEEIGRPVKNISAYIIHSIFITGTFKNQIIVDAEIQQEFLVNLRSLIFIHTCL